MWGDHSRLQDLLPPALLDLFTLWRRMGLMRNPRAGLFQGKGKNSTCSVSLGGRRSGPSTEEHGVHPLILGRLHLLLWTVSKAPQKAVSKVYCNLRNPG